MVDMPTSEDFAAARHALNRGIRFLAARQGADGLWRDFITPAGEASHWPTGFIGAALCAAGADVEMLQRAASALVAGQQADGGWGYSECVPTDADSTACALLFLAAGGLAESREAVERASACLALHQRVDSGGVATFRLAGPIRRFMGVGPWLRFSGWCQPHAEVTAMAGRAWSSLQGDEQAHRALAAWRYLRASQARAGCWYPYWWTSPHYATAQALELALSIGDAESAFRAGAWALRAQSAEGAWSLPGAPVSCFGTAWGLSILARSGVSPVAQQRAALRLVELQEADGGWASHPVMRIPMPSDREPDRSRWWRKAPPRGVVVQDQHRCFTTASCVAALARHQAHDAGRRGHAFESVDRAGYGC